MDEMQRNNLKRDVFNAIKAGHFDAEAFNMGADQEELSVKVELIVDGLNDSEILELITIDSELKNGFIVSFDGLIPQACSELNWCSTPQSGGLSVSVWL